MDRLELGFSVDAQVISAGLFVSPGRGKHPDRVIDSHELIFVRSGRLGIAEADRDYLVEAGESLWLRPGLRHRGTLGYGSDLSFYWVHFHVREHAQRSTTTEGILQHARPVRPERVAEWFHRLLEGMESVTGAREETNLLLMLLWWELGRVQLSEHKGQGGVLAARAEQFILLKFPFGIHAGDVAKAVGSNPDYLGRVFRRAYGCTVSEAIHRRQLQEGRALLREGGRTIDEVALACGFHEPRYFRKLFTDQQGISPREYRKLHARVYVNMQ